MTDLLADIMTNDNTFLITVFLLMGALYFVAWAIDVRLKRRHEGWIKIKDGPRKDTSKRES